VGPYGTILYLFKMNLTEILQVSWMLCQW